MGNRDKHQGLIRRVLKHVTKHRILYVIITALVMLIAGGLITYTVWPREQSLSTNPTVAQYQRQIPELRKQAEAEPKNADTQQNYAIALYASGETEAAKKQYEKVIALSPNDPVAYNNLANSQRDLGEINAAVSSYKKSLELNPHQANVYSNLANVQLYSLNDTQAAIDTYKSGLQELPKNSDLEYLLGKAYERNGDAELAVTTYRTILSYNPSHKPSLAELERLEK